MSRAYVVTVDAEIGPAMEEAMDRGVTVILVSPPDVSGATNSTADQLSATADVCLDTSSSFWEALHTLGATPLPDTQRNFRGDDLASTGRRYAALWAPTLTAAQRREVIIAASAGRVPTWLDRRLMGTADAEFAGELRERAGLRPLIRAAFIAEAVRLCVADSVPAIRLGGPPSGT